MDVRHETRFQEVAGVLQDYFDGIYEGSIDKLSRVLHPSLQLYCASDGTLMTMDRDTYFATVKGRESPEARKDPRFDEILSIEFDGPVTAHVRLRCAYLPKLYTDHLTLVHVEGRWVIVGKVFHFDLLDTY